MSRFHSHTDTTGCLISFIVKDKDDQWTVPMRHGDGEYRSIITLSGLDLSPKFRPKLFYDGSRLLHLVTRENMHFWERKGRKYL